MIQTYVNHVTIYVNYIYFLIKMLINMLHKQYP